MNGFVLAGGQSTRMGRDKALLEFDGQPLIAQAVELLRELGLTPRICGSRPDLARFAEVVADNFPQCGPVAGMEAALAASDAELNLFVPVDAPLLPAKFLRWMMERAERTQAVATVPRVEGRDQPLCAVYSRRMREGLRQALDAGHFKVMTAVMEAAASLGDAVDVFEAESVAAALGPGEWPSSPPVRDWFRNVNNREDFEVLCRHFASGANRRHPISYT